jgi:hypothetical protein
VLTVAIAGLALDHVTSLPVNTLLFASRIVADSCAVFPTTMLAEVGAIDSEATGVGAGTLTVIVDVALCPSLVAVTWTAPGPTAVTRPLPLTVATPGS